MTGEDIKAVRRKLSLTQEQLAEKLGVARNTVNRWEMGLIKPSKVVSLAIDTLLAKEKAKKAKKRGAEILRKGVKRSEQQGCCNKTQKTNNRLGAQAGGLYQESLR